MFGSHAPYTEREARGYRVFNPGGVLNAPGIATFKDMSFPAPRSAIGVRITAVPGGLILPGRKAHQPIPYDCQIIGTQIMADVAGSIEFDIYRTRMGSFPATAAQTLTPLSIGRPRLEGQQTRQDLALYGWTTTLLKDDVLLYEILSISGIASVTLTLILARNNQP